MGSYCETDGITQLPINYCDKVRLFILVHQNSEIEGGGICYPNTIWAPLGAGIQGTYDDCGGIENIVENSDTEILLNRLKEGMVLSKNRWGEILTAEKMTISSVISRIIQDPAFYKAAMMKEALLGVTFVLEEVYQTMISFDPIHTHYLDKGGWEYKPASQILKESFKTWYCSLNKKSHFDRNFDFLDYHDRSHVPYRELLLDLHEMKVPYEDPKIQAIYKSLAELIIFNQSMAAARKFWHPQSGKGSQDNELNIYKHLNKTIISRIENSEKMSEEDGCEKMDENGYYTYMLEHNQTIK